MSLATSGQMVEAANALLFRLTQSETFRLIPWYAWILVGIVVAYLVYRIVRTVGFCGQRSCQRPVTEGGETASPSSSSPPPAPSS